MGFSSSVHFAAVSIWRTWRQAAGARAAFRRDGPGEICALSFSKPLRWEVGQDSERPGQISPSFDKHHRCRLVQLTPSSTAVCPAACARGLLWPSIFHRTPLVPTISGQRLSRSLDDRKAFLSTSPQKTGISSRIPKARKHRSPRGDEVGGNGGNSRPCELLSNARGRPTDLHDADP